jgi:hypothetical protein
VMGSNLRAGVEFKIKKPQNKIRISLAGNKEYKGTFALDNLLVRRKDADVYQMKFDQKIKKKYFIVNNFILE